MTDKPTDEELKAMWQLHAADIGGIFDFARAVLAKWGTLRAEKIVIPTDAMEQEFQKHYRRGYESGKKATPPQASQPEARPGAEPVAWINEEQTIGPNYGKKRLSFEPFYSCNPLHYKNTPLYAAPPQAIQPLTDDQWQRIADTLDCFITRDEKNEIEAVLGIGAAQKGKP